MLGKCLILFGGAGGFACESLLVETAQAAVRIKKEERADTATGDAAARLRCRLLERMLEQHQEWEQARDRDL